MQSSDDPVEAVKGSLAKEAIHAEWIDNYESGLNDRFYELAIDEIVSSLAIPPGATVLDAGCGDGSKALRLARRGFKVVAVDFSTAVLARAREKLLAASSADPITLQQEDLTDLTFEDGTFDVVFCWGVLMHIPYPGVLKAIGELARVVKPGGALVIQESNSRSMQSTVQRSLMRLARRDMSDMHMVERGVEKWRQTPAGPLVTRNTDIAWLLNEVEGHGLTLIQRKPGEFSELYVRVKNPSLKKLVYLINRRWLRSGGSAKLAFGNILMFRKS